MLTLLHICHLQSHSFVSHVSNGLSANTQCTLGIEHSSAEKVLLRNDAYCSATLTSYCLLSHLQLSLRSLGLSHCFDSATTSANMAALQVLLLC